MVHRRHEDCASLWSRACPDAGSDARRSSDGGWRLMTMQHDLSRRTFLRATLGVVGVSLLAACAPSAPASKPAEAPAKPAAPAATTAPAAAAPAATAAPAAAAKPAEAAKPAAAAPAAAGKP